jgi:PAS domain S-box-containing protein
MSVFNLSKENERTIPWSVLIMFSLLTIGILLVAYSDYSSQRNMIIKDYQERITEMASLKTKQIELWRTEKLVDAELIINNGPLVKSIKAYLDDRNQIGIEYDLKKWMESLNSNYDYTGVFILDTLSKIRLAVTKSDSGIFYPVREVSDLVLKDPTVRMTDFYLNNNQKQPNIDLLIPLISNDRGRQSPFGIVVIRIDPGEILFPLIQSWPVSSKSSETLLVRRDGESVLFLNELRFMQNTALRFRLPLSDEKLPASVAIKGNNGLVEGLDYRNEPVVAFLSGISGTTWHMISKVDKKELLQPLKQYLSYEIIVIVLLILLNATLSVFWIWTQKLKMNRFKIVSKKALGESDEKFNKAFQMSPVTVTISSFTNSKFIDININFINDMEFSREEVIGRTANELGIWADENERLWVVSELRQSGKIFGKTLSYRTKTGKILYGLTSMSVIQVNGESCILSTAINITESFKAEARLKESEDLYNKLFHNMLNGFAYCKIIYSGDSPPDFMYINVNEAFESLTGLKNVVGKKASEAIPGIQESDPDLLDRYVRVAFTGIPESFEIFVESLKMWFAISVYSPEKGYFVAVFDVITERKNVELKLAFNAHLLSNVNDALVATDEQFRITYWNMAASKIYGWEAEEVIGKSGVQTLNTEWPSVDPEQMRHHIKETGNWIGEATQTRKDGSRFPVEVSSFVIRNTEGDITGYISVNRDISERKLAEEHLRETNQYLFNLFNYANVPIIVWDKSLKVTQFNHSFERVSGFQKEDVLGKSIDILFSEDNAKYALDLIHKAGKGERWETVELEIRRKDGSLRTVLWNSANIMDSENKEVVATIAQGHDITIRKQYETLLKYKNEELEKFNRTMVGREIRMVELKKEINELCLMLKLPVRYKATREIMKGMD